MQRSVFILIVCGLICVSAYCLGGTKWENAKGTAIEYLYSEVIKQMAPYMRTYDKDGKELVYEDMERFFSPIVWGFHSTKYQAVMKD